ncbi:probable F-box protein At4g22030 [Juglans regia]|uniref:Probable F-box protein At4g22030 n=1 Tax=Juglans regia TaxID=51240 RepID=A0A6P9EFQ9_JUGRE|nr:probable F-box protein At4g22030 [Juglans regia]
MELDPKGFMREIDFSRRNLTVKRLDTNQESRVLYAIIKKNNAAIHVPKLPKAHFSVSKISTTRKLIDELNNIRVDDQLYSLLEAVADRVEMHTNIRKQRDNWNTLLLNSINMITLTAAIMAGVAAIGGAGMPLLALKLSSTLMYSAAIGMQLVMNKIQPSQLAEEQRNATRLFKQLWSQIETMLALGATTEEDVKDMMERVLALDRAYPLPLLGAMLDNFPAKFELATWWPSHQLLRKKTKSHERKQRENNGWSEELEVEMRDVVEVVKRKDSKDYERLGNLVLKINKILSISGPLLTGIAAVGSACVGNGSWAAIVAMAAGALATSANAFQHGGQVGMVIEMYRNNGGFFHLLHETIEATLEERDLEKRENGELFEMKVALQLGRSLLQLEELARKSASCFASLIEYSVGPIGKQFSYLVFYKSSIATLEEKFRRVLEKKEAVQQSVNGAQWNQEVVASEVNTWLTNVEKKIEEIQKFLGEDVKANRMCLNGWCPDLKLCYSLGKKAQKNTQAIIQLLEEGEKYDKSVQHCTSIESKITIHITV